MYKDFRIAILNILGAQDNQEALLNGVAGMGNGMNEIPGSIVSVETAPSQHKNVVSTTTTSPPPAKYAHPSTFMGQNTSIVSQPQVLPFDPTRLPPIICIIGGPGSNKAMLCLKAIGMMPGWGHFRYLDTFFFLILDSNSNLNFMPYSIGRLVRTIAESDPKANTDNHAVKEAITKGEMISKKSIDKLIEQQLQLLSHKKGILIDGYPRDVAQVKDFEDKVCQQNMYMYARTKHGVFLRKFINKYMCLYTY